MNTQRGGVYREVKTRKRESWGNGDEQEQSSQYILRSTKCCSMCETFSERWPGYSGGPSIDHGLPKLPKFGKLFYNSYLQARILGGREEGGRWVRP